MIDIKNISPEDAAILKRWHAAEIAWQKTTTITDRCWSADLAKEMDKAILALKRVSDPVVREVIERLFQPQAGVSVSDPAYLYRYIEDEKSPYTELMNIAAALEEE